MNFFVFDSGAPRVGAALAAMLWAAMASAPDAHAAPAPAGSVITNIATVTYLAPEGLKTVRSNPVVTTVQPVGSFTLDGFATPTSTVVNSKNAGAGEQVMAQHVLKNLGNSADDFGIQVTPQAGAQFSRIAVYADSASKGAPPLCTSEDKAPSCTVPPTPVAPGESLLFEVVYTMAPQATAPTSLATIAASPVRPDKYTAANRLVSDQDQIALKSALFSLAKSIGSTTWPDAPRGGAKSSAADCATAWTPTLKPTATCQYTSYTLTVRNTGSGAGRFAMSDALPKGFSYVSNSSTWSGAPDRRLGDDGAGLPAGIRFGRSGAAGNTLNAVIDSIPAGATQSVSFMVLVNDGAEPGTSTTTNMARFLSGSAGEQVSPAAPPMYDAFSNPMAFEVTTADAIKTALTVTKEQAPDPTCAGAAGVKEAIWTKTDLSLPPGACILYRVRALNGTGQAVSNVMISDTLPAFTTLVAPSSERARQNRCMNGGSFPPMTGTPVGFGTSADGRTVTCGSVTNSMPGTSVLTLTFAVRIDDK